MEPITLDEIFMAAAAGEYDGELPEPVTRFQYYMKKIAEGAAVKPEDIDAAIEAYLNSHDADIVTEAELTQALAGYYDKTEIDTALGGKAAADHNHSGVYAPASHTHAQSDITDLDTALAGKAAANHNHTGVYAPASHSHAQTDITDLDTTLAGKAAANHNHTGVYAPLSHSDAVSLYDSGSRVTLSLSGTTYIAIPSSFNLSDYKAIEVIYHQGAISGNDSFASARSIKGAQSGAFTNLSLIQLSGSSSSLSISHSVLSLSTSDNKLTIVAGANVSVSRIVGWK